MNQPENIRKMYNMPSFNQRVTRIKGLSEKGYCQCGCGRKTKIIPYSNKSIGWKKGEPMRFIHGHNAPFRGYVASDEAKKKISNTLKILYADPANTPSWRGGVIKSIGGYTRVWVKNHPYKGSYYESKARLIAEKVLRRFLRSGEVVHHINSNRSDDRKCNLIICSDSFHKYIHGKIRGGLNHAGI